MEPRLETIAARRVVLVPVDAMEACANLLEIKIGGSDIGGTAGTLVTKWGL